MKWYKKLCIGAGIAATLFTGSIFAYNKINPPKKQINHYSSKELEKMIKELDRYLEVLNHDLEEDTKACDELIDLLSKSSSGTKRRKYTPIFSSTESDPKVREVIDYLKQSLDMTRTSEYEAEKYASEIARNSGLEFLKYLHDELLLESVESKLIIDKDEFRISQLDDIAKVLNDSKAKERLMNPNFKNFLNYWRKFPVIAANKFVFSDMAELSELEQSQAETDFSAVEDMFEKLGYEKGPVIRKDIDDLAQIKKDDIYDAAKRKCSINDLYMHELIELYPQVRTAYRSDKLQESLEQRLAGLAHLFRKEGREKDSNYTERPDLSQVDRLNQVRIRLILDSLQDDSVLKTLGRQAFIDMKDKRTEHGGIVMFDGKQVRYIEQASGHANLPECDFFDGTYSPTYNQYNIGGICTYHFHALKSDLSEYAGPSRGDLAVMKKYKCTGVVITTIGGKKINVDFFYKTADGKEVVVDLGVYEVPK